MGWGRRKREDDEPVTEDPRSYVMRALGTRDYSRAQLETKLRARGHAPESIKNALENLIGEGWFKEDAFVSARVRALLSKNYGPTWIKAKLRSEKVTVSDEAIDAGYDHLGFGEADQVRELVRKALASTRVKKKFLEDARLARGRLVHGVVTKGHPVAMVMRIVGEMMTEKATFSAES